MRTIRILAIALTLAFPLVLALAACNHTQKTIGGAAAGGVTGALVAGPIGAAVGAGAGAIAAPAIAGN
jgi:hypothetical protein